MNDNNINVNDGITTRSDVRITGWGISRDELNFTIRGIKYTLSKKNGLVGPGTAMSNYYAVQSAFYKDGDHGTDVIRGLRESACSDTFRHWRDELLELVDQLEEMVTTN